jgi:hypothetical protein
MLLRALCLSTYFLGVFAWDSLRLRVPGVAFGLSPDYGYVHSSFSATVVDKQQIAQP